VHLSGERSAGGIWCRGSRAFASLHAPEDLRTPAADEVRGALLAAVAPLRRRDDSLGGPHPVERASAVAASIRAMFGRCRQH